MAKRLADTLGAQDKSQTLYQPTKLRLMLCSYPVARTMEIDYDIDRRNCRFLQSLNIISH
jgi:hypothetical protein